MKAIQVMFDERLLEKLAALDEVQKDGRSFVLRRAVEAYLRQRGRASIATQYKKAYRGGKGLGGRSLRDGTSRAPGPTSEPG